MVRKQLYIGDDQERLLKSRSRELGVSEAELVRRAIDTAIGEDQHQPLPRPGVAVCIQEFIAEADAIAGSANISPTQRREELYADRLDQLTSMHTKGTSKASPS